MVKDLRYIFKRILIGVGIALVLSFLRGNLFILAKAYTLSVPSACTYLPGENGVNCSLVPVYGSRPMVPGDGGMGFNVWFQNQGLLEVGKSYNIIFRAEVLGRVTDISSDLNFDLYTGNGGSAGNVATPDRNENKIIYSIGSNRYRIIWSFQLDSLHDYDTMRVSWFNDMNINNGDVGALLDSSLEISTIGSDSSSDTGAMDIINNNNDNTGDIIQNNNNNTQQIIDNQNQNTQDIIDNQNQNNQALIDNINNQFTYCKDSDFKITFDMGTIKNKYFASNGLQVNNNATIKSNIYILDVSNVDSITFTSVNGRTNGYYCLMREINGNIVADYCPGVTNFVGEKTLSTTYNNTKFDYVGFTVNQDGIITIKDFSEECGNRLDDMNNNMNDINNSLNDDSGVDNSEIEDLFGDIRGNSNSPVSDLLTLPITLLQAYLDGMNGTCTPYNLGTLYGTSLILPCIDIPGIIGTNLWNVVDALFCIYMIYNIAMMCISIYELFTGLNDGTLYLYSPQHSGNSRVSRNEELY